MTKIFSTQTPFTKSEMEEELREVLFVQASQIAHAGSPRAAQEFLGFDFDFSPVATVDQADINRIDLTRFAASRYMSSAYDYAFQCGHPWDYGEDHNHNITALSDGVVPYAAYGDRSPFLSPESKCRHVIDLAMGRWCLETDRDLTIRQLSLLAAMTEAAVRNSLSSERIETHGKPVSVAAKLAIKWLSARRGFIPTNGAENRQQYWLARTRTLLASPHIGTGLQTILADLELTPEALAKKAGVPPNSVQALLDCASVNPNIQELRKIGEALDLDVPYFVGQAIEASLRVSS
jgi:hypothetical protein